MTPITTAQTKIARQRLMQSIALLRGTPAKRRHHLIPHLRARLQKAGLHLPIEEMVWLYTDREIERFGVLITEMLHEIDHCGYGNLPPRNTRDFRFQEFLRELKVFNP